MSKKKVLITGAAGIIATKIIPELRKIYDLTLVDVKKENCRGEKLEEIKIADLTNWNRDNYRSLFQDKDAVIHCAYIQSMENGKHTFPPELTNIQMAYNVYQTCVEAEVGRLVVMSSNHAGDYYERLIHQGKMLSVTPDMKPKSDNYYGWAKISYEALGFVFATGKNNEGDKLENVQLRIGAPREDDIDSCEHGDLIQMHRDLATYLSLRDEIQLIEKSIETESIEDKNGIPFQIFYGISNNSHKFWDISNAREVIGYEPQDDSSVRFSEEVREITKDLD